jgi:GNAT superfamily N-acetyltransferase
MNFLIRAAEPADAAKIAIAHSDSWNTRYRGILPDRLLDGTDLAGQTARWSRILGSTTRGRFVLVAVAEDGEIAGLISAGSCRSQKLDFDAEIYAVYVASKYWRQRLGLRLMAAAAQRLALFGHKDVMLWSLEDNLEARAFYERLGGEEIGRMVEQMGGAELREIGYGWRKIDLLLRVCDELPFQ